ncbi:MAG: 16S rRNA (guanine(527)-N(7))-methyltransferase RsmG [Eubacteriales bacterium]|nr:16S rRNA (guanine(527)-N(7))-methyltransferase RsmG [Eubacteriales bacterium]
MTELRLPLAAAGLELDETALSRLETYHDMLLDWNTRMDLTSVSADRMAARHFLDSLLPLKASGLIPEEGRLIDVGTGAGFPGLPLAIARPSLQVTLLEAQGKRCQFLQAVCQALGLENVTIINDRAENLGRAEGHREGYDRAVARAVAALPVLAEYLLPFVRVGGMALCWKGPAVAGEQADGAAAAARLGGRLLPLVDMEGSGEETGHVIAPMEKTEKTLPLYPRKNGMPAKRPLKADKS